MNTHSTPHPAMQTLIDTFGEWLRHRRDLNEMRLLDRTDFDSIANDLRVSPGDMEELVRQGSHASDELPKMLEQLGIDENRLARTQPLLMRDLERVCALCCHKAQCDRDLASGTAAEHYDGYCPNASTLETLDRDITAAS